MNVTCPIPDHMSSAVELAHGGGGRMTQRLIDEVFHPFFSNPYLDRAGDGAIMPNSSLDRLAMSTDTFVVSPLFFPGGNIGDLAINGTVNDILCCGARPRWLSAAFVIEEGMPIDKLRDIVRTMSEAAREAEIEIVTGDTKVVERGRCDGVYINTTGIGFVRPDLNLDPSNLREGDVVILTGTIANHGMAVMSVREDLGFSSSISSDTASLCDIVNNVIDVAPHLRVLRDPTRGGLSSTLNELAQASGVSIEIDEQAIPIADDVRAACELLGLDPLYVANEGLMIVVVPPDEADRALAAVRRSAHGSRGAVIGRVTAPDAEGPRVWLRLPLGNRRLVEMLSGEQLPRIC